MSKSSAVVVGRGRPEQYSAGFIRAFKVIVRRHGLLKGREVINANGVTVGGKHRDVSISLPTLSKYVKRDEVGGKAVPLFRGRPTKKAA
jgi:hypothetical protein